MCIVQWSLADQTVKSVSGQVGYGAASDAAEGTAHGLLVCSWHVSLHRS